MRLKILHPEVADRNCKHCLVYQFDDTTGELQFGRDGKPELRLLNSGPSFLAACRDPSRGCPKGTPENPKTLSEDNLNCLQHYRECEAVGCFPDDAVVRRNAAAIKGVLDSCDKSKAKDQMNLTLRAIAKCLPQ